MKYTKDHIINDIIHNIPSVSIIFFSTNQHKFRFVFLEKLGYLLAPKKNLPHSCAKDIRKEATPIPNSCYPQMVKE